MVATRSGPKKSGTQTGSDITSSVKKSKKKASTQEVTSDYSTNKYNHATGSHTIPEEVVLLRQEAKKPKSLLNRLGRWVHLQVFRYTYLFGPYNFDFWEGLLVAAIQLFIAVLIVYGVIKNSAKVFHYLFDKVSQS